ncbi:glycosyl hydrolase family 28-related protein [Spirosoma aerophilum]
MAINVKDTPYNAKGDGLTDDSTSIQQAINFAKSLSTGTNGAYRATIYFPAGRYLVNTSINVTNTDGIWLLGDGGSFLNTTILGNTGNRAIFDFSGSSYSGCENFYFVSPSGSPANTSTLGVQFALTTNGGLNCGIKKCHIQFNDNASANGGLGCIGILNIRSEEFYIHECLVRSNSPLILSYTANVVISGANYNATSAYQTLASGTGSMGVVSINGTSLQSIEKRQPALILIGTNSINFQGYLGRASSNAGTNETAVLCTTSTTNLKIHGTIESFSRFVKVAENSGFENCDFDIVMANSSSPTTELIDVTNCITAGLKARISLPVPSERNRIVLYHAPAGGGNQQAAGYAINSEITCFAISDNQLIISANLLRRSTNISLNTSAPFEKRNGRLKLLTNNTPVIGVVGSLTSLTIFRFKEARLTSISNNSGYYRLWIDGVLKAGGYGSGKAATLCFQAQIVVNQRYDGILDPLSITVIILDQSVTDPAYLNINGLTLDLTFSNNIGSVLLTPRVSGSGTGEPVYYEGFTELQSDFFVNDPIPLS